MCPLFHGRSFAVLNPISLLQHKIRAARTLFFPLAILLQRMSEWRIVAWPAFQAVAPNPIAGDQMPCRKASIDQKTVAPRMYVSRRRENDRHAHVVFSQGICHTPNSLVITERNNMSWLRKTKTPRAPNHNLSAGEGNAHVLLAQRTHITWDTSTAEGPCQRPSWLPPPLPPAPAAAPRARQSSREPS